MEEKNKKSYYFIKEFLQLDLVKALELYDDQGVKVSTHTYDVLNLSIGPYFSPASLNIKELNS